MSAGRSTWNHLLLALAVAGCIRSEQPITALLPQRVAGVPISYAEQQNLSDVLEITPVAEPLRAATDSVALDRSTLPAAYTRGVWPASGEAIDLTAVRTPGRHASVLVGPFVVALLDTTVLGPAAATHAEPGQVGGEDVIVIRRGSQDPGRLLVYAPNDLLVLVSSSYPGPVVEEILWSLP